jgi:Family of unknown function (DUF6492)
MTAIAFVTPTYRPDLGRCELLVQSVRQFAPQISHYLIVDHRDIAAFRHLAGPRTILVPSEEIMDKSYRRLIGPAGIWFSLRAPPVRGWIAQQLMKLGSPQVLCEEVLVCIDSDVTFVRPFDRSHVQEQGKLGLLDVNYTGGMVPRWTAIAEDLLGLQTGSVPLRGHVGNLIVWSRDTLLRLHSHVEQATGLPWQIAVGRRISFSEYVLYGVFVREVLGYANSAHAPTDRPLVRQPWDHDLTSEAGLNAYINAIDPGNIAVMIHSKDGISADQQRQHYHQAWKAAS